MNLGKNLRIFINFPNYLGGIFLTKQFSHLIAFLLIDVYEQIMENVHNCGNFGHTKQGYYRASYLDQGAKI